MRIYFANIYLLACHFLEINHTMKIHLLSPIGKKKIPDRLADKSIYESCNYNLENGNVAGISQ